MIKNPLPVSPRSCSYYTCTRKPLTRTTPSRFQVAIAIGALAPVSSCWIALKAPTSENKCRGKIHDSQNIWNKHTVLHMRHYVTQFILIHVPFLFYQEQHILLLLNKYFWKLCVDECHQEFNQRRKSKNEIPRTRKEQHGSTSACPPFAVDDCYTNGSFDKYNHNLLYVVRLGCLCGDN